MSTQEVWYERIPIYLIQSACDLQFQVAPSRVSDVYAANIQRRDIVKFLRFTCGVAEVTDELIEDERRDFARWLEEWQGQPFRSQTGAWMVYTSQWVEYEDADAPAWDIGVRANPTTSPYWGIESTVTPEILEAIRAGKYFTKKRGQR